jgi:hypothetical protein
LRRTAAAFAVWAMAIGAGIVQAQSPSCADLRAQKEKVYGFHLTQLNETQIDAKSKEIDAYWKQLQGAGPEGVSCLKEMLAAEKSDHIFQFDAASFLFQLDKSPESLNLVKDAIVQTDFQETDPANYLSLALDLGQRGVNIQSLAARLLLFPNAIIHISEHSLDLRFGYRGAFFVRQHGFREGQQGADCAAAGAGTVRARGGGASARGGNDRGGVSHT